ncbi:formate transporter FocA [Vibrio sp. JC009]|uniref:formate transporter FocA n=1 Tax=Vibrio sp. JC009 TaxID=2912314 RepID=UPI0023B056A5|nr:formate transporter FocA [Vibrio sp. JC009]WED24429.1 formate transporter FocA [Vibrio sp. JC009]
MPTSNTVDMKQIFSPKEMMAEAEKFADGKVKKTTSMTISLAIMAGAFIGLAFLFYITVTTGNTNTGWGISRLAGGLAFSMGLILIVLCGGELFTSSVLSCIAWANRKISFQTMLTLWAKVYLGNFIGAILLVALVTGAGLYQLDGGQWGLNALHIAQHKLHHTTSQAISLGILCNFLVCLAIWLTFSTQNALAKAFMVMLPVAMFVSSGFEHCVANMFMVPLGIVIKTTAPAEFWTQLGVSADHFADLNLHHFITANLLPVTLGNIIGGSVLVGLSNWSIYRRPELVKAEISSITTKIKTDNVKELTMNNHLQIKDIMNPAPVVLRADMPVELALDSLLDNREQGAPVVDMNGKLVGFFSVHDVMVELWCQDYIPVEGQKVVDLMSRDLLAIDANDSLVSVAEFMCIDKEQLYPATDMGIAIRMTSLSVEERAKSMQVKKPQILPVLENDVLVGTVSRLNVATALRAVYGERIDMVEADEVLVSA